MPAALATGWLRRTESRVALTGLPRIDYIDSGFLKIFDVACCQRRAAGAADGGNLRVESLDRQADAIATSHDHGIVRRTRSRSFTRSSMFRILIAVSAIQPARHGRRRSLAAEEAQEAGPADRLVPAVDAEPLVETCRPLLGR